MGKRWAVAVLLAGGVAQAVPTTFHINEVSYDPNTKRAKVAYQLSDDHKVEIFDGGKVALCALLRLIRKKYQFYLSLKDGQAVSRTDVGRMNRAIQMLPAAARSEFVKASRAYVLDSTPEKGTEMLEEFIGAIGKGFDGHPVDFTETGKVISDEANELFGKANRAERVDECILQGTKLDQLPEDERDLVKKHQTNIKAWRDQARALPLETKTESGQDPANELNFCLASEGSKSTATIDNTNVDELLDRVDNVVKQVLPPPTARPAAAESGTRRH